MLCRGLLRCGFSVDCTGKAQVPPKGRVILCSNHHRVTDPPILACVLDRPVSFMAKSELFTDHGKVAAFFLRRFGAFPVKRNAADANSVKTAVGLLEEEQLVGIFPQGGCVAPGLPFQAKAGVAMLALKTRSPVVPVWISYGEKTGVRQPVSIRFGPAIDTVPFGEAADRKAVRELTACITKTMNTLGGV